MPGQLPLYECVCVCVCKSSAAMSAAAVAVASAWIHPLGQVSLTISLATAAAAAANQSEPSGLEFNQRLLMVVVDLGGKGKESLSLCSSLVTFSTLFLLVSFSQASSIETL